MFKKVFVALALTGLGAKAQLMPGQVVIKPASPKAGTSVQVTYSPVKNPAQSKKITQAIVYRFTNYQWRTDTLVMSPTSGVLKASIKLDSKSAFLALKFNPEPGGDRSDKYSYTWLVTDNNGKKLPGGPLAQALFRMPSGMGGPPGYFEKIVVRPSADTLKALLDEEQTIKGSSPGLYTHAYLALQRAIKGPQFKSEAPVMLETLLNSNRLSVQDSIEIYRIYGFEIKNADRAAVLKKQIISQHPHGDFARLDAYQQTINAANPKESIAMNEKLLADFPVGEQPKYSPQQDYIYYGVYRNLATAYFQEHQFEPLIRLRKSWDFKTENEVYRANIDRIYILKSMPLADVEPVADSLLQDLFTKVADGSYRIDFDTMDQAMANARKQINERLWRQIMIDYNLGKNEKALYYWKKIPDDKAYENAEINEIHVALLDRTGQQQDVKKLIEQCVKHNAVTVPMFARLKEIYAREHRDSSGYEAYLSSLKSAKEVSDLTAEVMQHMVNLDLMPFALEDLDGKLIRSSDWEGRIVVVDFWATWCRPCIGAFPGMQMLVDKYAKDPKVDVYFIGTMQFGDYRQKMKDFITREGWRFKVLADGVNKKTGAQDAVFSTLAPVFHSSGIPRKIIIKDGVIRYTTEGYSGSPSQLADELSYAIEILKAEK